MEYADEEASFAAQAAVECDAGFGRNGGAGIDGLASSDRLHVAGNFVRRAIHWLGVVGGLLSQTCGECGELPQQFPFGTIFKHKSPISFWLGIGAHGLFAVFLVFIGLRIVGWAPHWFIALMKK
jgi:hypothetical protein